MRQTKHDMTGHRFGHWTVIARAGVTPDGRMPLWLCRCSCGMERDVRAGNLRSGLTLSCGCMKPTSSKVNRPTVKVGERYGRLMVLRRLPDSEVACRCDCGAEGAFKVGNLSTGKSKSCGCLRREAAALRHFRHGMCDHPAYASLASAKDRCINPDNKDFHLYGGRGISVCTAWQSFACFWDAMGPSWFSGATLDRIDGNGDYEPSNCRWLTIQDQQNNKATNVMMDTPWGIITMMDASKKSGIPYGKFRNDFRRGMPTTFARLGIRSGLLAQNDCR